MSGLELAAVGDVALHEAPGREIFRAPWDAADLRIANLEAPLAEGGVPAAKLIRLKSPPAAAGWLRDLGCDAVSLANNHVMDWGEPGLRSTLRALDAAGIPHAGAGMDLAEAKRPVMIEARGRRIAFLSWACTVPVGFDARADRPGLAGVRVRTSYDADGLLIDEQPGTAPWTGTEARADDVALLVDAISSARDAADAVVLAMHWGVPPQWHAPFQGPLADYQPPLARAAVAAGADLILGHHAHTVFGLEAIASGGRQGLVCYSLGNYLFHPLATPTVLRLEGASHPYVMEERSESHETYVARFTFAPGPGGRLGVAGARLHPAILDERCEARAPSVEAGWRIADRVARFSAWRSTDVVIEDGVVVWERT